MHDLAVIGGGPGGYVAAIRAAQHGLNVLLVERDRLGGTCLNRGCIPTKSFIHDTKLYNAVKRSGVLRGAAGVSLDAARMLERKNQLVNNLVRGLEAILQSHRIEVVKGQARLEAPGRMSVAGLDGARVDYRTRHVVLATGSRPQVPPFAEPDGLRVQTTDEALNTEEIPRRVAIIGGGVIGMEMAGIFLNLGASVCVLELLSDILVTEDHEIRRAVAVKLRQRGVEIRCGVKVQALSFQGEGVGLTCADAEGRVFHLQTDRVLLATGRRPVMDGIEPARTGLQTDGPYIRVNSRMETSLPGVFAIGDLVGGMMLAHKASAEAEAAVAGLLGRKKDFRPERVPRCIWSVFEIGAVGLTEAQARAGGRRIKVGRFSFANSGAAGAMGAGEGFAKVIGDADTGEVLGVHILGEHATELIGEAAALMTLESTVEDLAEAIKPHPTLGETLMEAAMDWSGGAIHGLRRTA